MEELIRKIGHKIPEVSDRAINTIHSKLQNKISSIQDFLAIQNGIIAGALLYWINERQTSADIQTINNALQIILEISGTPEGHLILQEIQAIDFFNAYYNHTAEALQQKISLILNLLVSPPFSVPKPFRAEIKKELPIDLEKPPIPTKLPQPLPGPKIQTKTFISTHSEYPPILLCETDEKLIFDIGVLVKFGSAEEMIESCELIQTRLFKDFPFDCLLQRSDFVGSLAELAKVAVEKQNFGVAYKVMCVLEDFLKKLGEFVEEVSKPTFRPVTVIPKKTGARPEFLEIAHPCLELAKWENGTPGGSLSVLSAVELIILGVPLEESSLLGQAIKIWEAGLWAFRQLVNYPDIVASLIENISRSIQKLTGCESPEGKIALKNLLSLSSKVLYMIPEENLQSILGRNNQLIGFLAEFIIFQDEDSRDLIPYIQAVDPRAIKEYEYALKCRSALELNRKLAVMLSNEKMPIASPSMFYRALEFFENVLPSLEFHSDLSFAVGVIDLNIYSISIDKNSGLDPCSEKSQSLLWKLLICPVEKVRQEAIRAIREALIDENEVNSEPRSSIKLVLLEEDILGEIILNFPELIPSIVSTNEDYAKLQPYFTVIQGLAGQISELGGVLLVLTNLFPNAQPLRFIRDLFSNNPANRAIANHILSQSKSPESIQKNWSKAQENIWEVPDTLDVVEDLTKPGELDLVEVPNIQPATQEEIQALINIIKSTSLESSLKVASAEQILVHLLTGSEELIDEIIEIFIVSIAGLAGNDRAERKLMAKSLEILVVVALLYPSKARKLYQASVKFVCAIIPHAFSEYYELKYYSLYLIYILAFSNLLERNRFLPENFELMSIKTPNNGKLAPVPVSSLILEFFSHPFVVQKLGIKNKKKSEEWEMIPCPERVKEFLFRAKESDIKGEMVLDELSRSINEAETHNDLLKPINDWSNLVVLSEAVNTSVFHTLLTVETGVFSGILSIMRSLPTNKAEDTLYTRILNHLEDLLLVINPERSSFEFDFINNLCIITERNLIPFLLELSIFDQRETLVTTILRLTSKLLPMHGSGHPSIEENSIKVFTRFQLEPGEGSLLGLSEKLLQSTEDFSILEETCKLLRQVLNTVQLNLPLDLKSSPVSQKQFKDCLQIIITKFLPFTTTTNFVNAGAVKEVLKFFIKGRKYLNCESYMWLVRLSEHRNSNIRLLSWTLIMLIPGEIYYSHTTILDSALEVTFSHKECFGVKARSAGFIWNLLEYFIDQEVSEETTRLLNTLNSFGVLSLIKTALYENTGVSGEYIGSLGKILYCMTVLDYSHTAPVCLEIDIWDPLVRLVRPKAMIERMEVEPREPCRPYTHISIEDCLSGLIELLEFTSLMMKNNTQITDYLLESSHLINYLSDWIEEIQRHFNYNDEQLFGSAVVAVVTCLHLCVFEVPEKAKQALSEVKTESLADILDEVQSLEVKLAISRLLTSISSEYCISGSERLIVSFASLYKQSQDSFIQKEVLSCISTLLYYNDDAKEAALAIGFDKYISDTLFSCIQKINVEKTPEEILCQEITQLLILIKMWAANSSSTKSQLSFSEGSISPLFLCLFKLWPLSIRKESLLISVLEVLCTLCSGCEEAKKACAVIQENRKSVMSSLMEFASRPELASDSAFKLALQLLGTISTSKEGRQLLIKSKYPQGLANRLVSLWNENKDPSVIPVKSPSMFEFLATLSFFSEGEKALASTKGLIEILSESLERFSNYGMKFEVVEKAMLLLRNLCFANKAHVLASPQTLSLMLACISSSNENPVMRKLSSSAIWALLYNNEKVKGILSKESVISEIRRVYDDLDSQISREKSGKNQDEMKETRDNLNYILKICINV